MLCEIRGLMNPKHPLIGEKMAHCVSVRCTSLAFFQSALVVSSQALSTTGLAEYIQKAKKWQNYQLSKEGMPKRLMYAGTLVVSIALTLQQIFSIRVMHQFKKVDSERKKTYQLSEI